MRFRSWTNKPTVWLSFSIFIFLIMRIIDLKELFLGVAKIGIALRRRSYGIGLDRVGRAGFEVWCRVYFWRR